MTIVPTQTRMIRRIRLTRLKRSAIQTRPTRWYWATRMSRRDITQYPPSLILLPSVKLLTSTIRKYRPKGGAVERKPNRRVRRVRL